MSCRGIQAPKHIRVVLTGAAQRHAAFRSAGGPVTGAVRLEAKAQPAQRPSPHKLFFYRRVPIGDASSSAIWVPTISSSCRPFLRSSDIGRTRPCLSVLRFLLYGGGEFCRSGNCTENISRRLVCQTDRRIHDMSKVQLLSMPSLARSGSVRSLSLTRLGLLLGRGDVTGLPGLNQVPDPPRAVHLISCSSTHVSQYIGRVKGHAHGEPRSRVKVY